jgi:hypothetical protein
MPTRHQHSTDEIRRLHKFKSHAQPVGSALGEELVGFFKQSVAKRQTRLGKIAESWNVLVPNLLSEHCALEAYDRGTLTVVVDSSAHLYELKQLLLAGLDQQLKIACKATGLRKITLRPGRWYEGEAQDGRKLRFSRR